MHRKYKHRKHKEMEEQDIPYNVSRLIRASLQQDIPVENVSNKRQGLGYPKPHSRMPIRSYDAHDENKLVNHRQTLRPTTRTSTNTQTTRTSTEPGTNTQTTRTSTEPGLSNKQNTMSSDVYTSFYGVKFKIAERDKDGNPSGIADAAGRVWHKGPNGKFPMDETGDDNKVYQQQLDAKIKAGLKTGGEVVGAVGSAYSAYQGVKEIYNAVHNALNRAEDDLDLDLPTEEELAQLEEDVAQLPAEEEETAAFEELTTTLDELAVVEPSIAEITENFWQRFTDNFPQYTGQVPFNDPQPQYDNYQTPTEETDLHGEDLEAAEEAAAEEAAADYQEVEGVGALTEGLAETVAEESAYDTAVGVAESLGEVLLELAPFGI